jgi:outer membrane protein OmpA-like peptidoglycan-associated protein
MKLSTIKIFFISAALALTCILQTGCSSMSKTQRGAAIGAGAGGTIGAFIGKAAGNTALGAVIGGAIGGTAGAFIGRKMDSQASEIQSTVPGATVTREGEGIIVKFDSGILFDVNQTDLKPAAKVNLKNLATSLQNHPQTNVLIVGHTDSLGSSAYNHDLSVRRAESVKSYLETVGIAQQRLSVQGKGDAEPIASNSTPEGRSKNRRVEIVIVANDDMKMQAKQNAN